MQALSTQRSAENALNLKCEERLILGSKEQKISTLSLKLRRCKPRSLSILDGQLKQPVEGEEKTMIPLQNLQHPAHQVQLGTSTLKKVQQVGQLWRP